MRPDRTKPAFPENHEPRDPGTVGSAYCLETATTATSRSPLSPGRAPELPVSGYGSTICLLRRSTTFETSSLNTAVSFMTGLCRSQMPPSSRRLTRYRIMKGIDLRYRMTGRAMPQRHNPPGPCFALDTGRRSRVMCPLPHALPIPDFESCGYDHSRHIGLSDGDPSLHDLHLPGGRSRCGHDLRP